MGPTYPPTFVILAFTGAEISKGAGGGGRIRLRRTDLA